MDLEQRKESVSFRLSNEILGICSHGSTASRSSKRGQTNSHSKDKQILQGIGLDIPFNTSSSVI